MIRFGTLSAALLSSALMIAPAMAAGPNHGGPGMAGGAAVRGPVGGGAPMTGATHGATNFAAAPNAGAPANHFAANGWNGHVAGNRDFDHFHRFNRGPSFGFGFGFGAPYYDDYAYDDYPYYDTYAYYDEPYVTEGATIVPDQAYCVAHFRSYNPATGTYIGYDGLPHPCP